MFYGSNDAAVIETIMGSSILDEIALMFYTLKVTVTSLTKEREDKTVGII